MIGGLIKYKLQDMCVCYQISFLHSFALTTSFYCKFRNLAMEIVAVYMGVRVKICGVR